MLEVELNNYVGGVEIFDLEYISWLGLEWEWLSGVVVDIVLGIVYLYYFFYINWNIEFGYFQIDVYWVGFWLEIWSCGFV